MLKHSGKSEPTFLELTQQFVRGGSPCALLGLRNCLTRRRLMEDIWMLQDVAALRHQQMHGARRMDNLVPRLIGFPL